MSHPNESTHESTPLERMIQVLDAHGFDGMAHAMQIFVNEAMKIERNQVLGAQPYERTSERHGYANGFKPKTLATRVATLFPNEASLLRLVSAVLAKVDEEWQTGKTYLNTETDRSHQRKTFYRTTVALSTIYFDDSETVAGINDESAW